MKFFLFILFSCLAGNLCSCASGKKMEPEELNLETVSFQLPPPIEAQRADAASWARIYRSSDGTIFLRDDANMELWVKNDSQWCRLVSKIRIYKTFGGEFPWLPVVYLGGGFFAVSETAAGNVREKSDDGFPHALATTFLLDSKDGRIKDRTKPFVYDHNPPVRVPQSWSDFYQFRVKR